MHPIESANIILIIVGVILVISGPVIVYRTIKGMLDARKEDASAKLHLFSNGLNFLIAVIFLVAGVLFIINNLRGNPLHFKSQTDSVFRAG